VSRQAGSVDQEAGIRILSLDEGPSLSIVSGGGEARAVLWPGNGSKHRSLHYLRLDAGSTTVRLSHPMEAVYYIISGTPTVVDASESRPLEPGTMVLVEPLSSYEFHAGPRPAEIVGGPCPPDDALYAGLQGSGGLFDMRQGGEQVDGMLLRKVVHGERMTVTRYSFPPRGRFRHHVHEQEQVTYCVSGDITFVVDGRGLRLTPGFLVVIPADSAHSAVAGDDGAEVVSVVSPRRTEAGFQFLEKES
jgi:quercetin dioxygenase-like cupin family protein